MVQLEAEESLGWDSGVWDLVLTNQERLSGFGQVRHSLWASLFLAIKWGHYHLCCGLPTSCRPERDRLADPEDHKVTSSRLMREPLPSPPWAAGRQDADLVCGSMEERDSTSFSSLCHRLRDYPTTLLSLCSWTSSKWNFLNRLSAGRKPLLVWGWGLGGRGGEQVLGNNAGGALKTVACWGHVRGWGMDRGHSGPGPWRDSLLFPRLTSHTPVSVTGSFI